MNKVDLVIENHTQAITFIFYLPKSRLKWDVRFRKQGGDVKMDITHMEKEDFYVELDMDVYRSWNKP